MPLFTFAVLGGGAGDRSLAADLARRGHRVRLYSRSSERLLPIAAAGGLQLRGVLGEVDAPLELAAADLPACLGGADAIVLSVPAMEREAYAALLAPLLRGDEAIILCPGTPGSSLAFARQLSRLAPRCAAFVAEVAPGA